jgi:hypothetical protein
VMAHIAYTKLPDPMVAAYDEEIAAMLREHDGGNRLVVLVIAGAAALAVALIFAVWRWL